MSRRAVLAPGQSWNGKASAAVWGSPQAQLVVPVVEAAQAALSSPVRVSRVGVTESGRGIAGTRWDFSIPFAPLKTLFVFNREFVSVPRICNRNPPPHHPASDNVGPISVL